MEIGPIPGIRALGAIDGRRKVVEAPAVFDVDGAARPGDGVVMRTGRKGEGAEEDEGDPEREEEIQIDGDEASSSVNYFA
jgi:hypothetical protein